MHSSKERQPTGMLGAGRRLAVAACALSLAFSSRCSPVKVPEKTGVEPDASEVEALIVQPGNLGGVDAAKLRERLAGSSFAYFRFIDSEFTAKVCAEHRAELASEPIVNLHGDAHVEQYAVAADGRGLADFDSATRGEPLVDWLRFTTSLRIAASNQKLGDPDPAIEAFFRGYRAGLANENVDNPEPRLARMLRERFVAPSTWLERVSAFIVPANPFDVQNVGDRATLAVERDHPTLGDDFFRVKRAGAIQMGIGSARASKYLVRIEGSSPSDADDVVLEAKQVISAPAADCRDRPVTLEDAEQVIEGQRRLSRVPPPFLGAFEYGGSSFYVHSWRENYSELSHTSFETMTDLVEVAFDVGVQLGHGHPKDIDDGRAPPLRTRLDALATRLEPMVVERSKELARLVDLAWRRGTAQSPSEGASDDPRDGSGDL